MLLYWYKSIFRDVIYGFVRLQKDVLSQFQAFVPVQMYISKSDL